MIPVAFHTSSDIVIIGQHFENADYDNPHGYVYGYASFVVAEAANGQRKRIYITSSSCELEALKPAEKMAAALNVRLAKGKLPVAFDQWEDTFPAYGSDAYDEFDTIEWERSLEDRGE